MLKLHEYNDDLGFNNEVWEMITEDGSLFITNSDEQGGFIWLKQCKNIYEFKKIRHSEDEKIFTSALAFNENEWKVFKGVISQLTITHG